MDYKALMDAKKAEDAIKESKVSLTKKIKESLELIDDFEKSGVYVSDSHDNARTAKRILREIKETLS